jgi:hypothetical protein
MAEPRAPVPPCLHCEIARLIQARFDAGTLCYRAAVELVAQVAAELLEVRDDQDPIEAARWYADAFKAAIQRGDERRVQ